MESNNWNELQLEKIKNICKNLGGECLSAAYFNAKTKLEVKCGNKDHPSWWVLPGSILKGHWCKQCVANNSRIKTEAKLREIVEKRHGKVISGSYIHQNSQFIIECFYKHRWKVRPSSIIYGNWCIECSSGLSERICRIYFETLFQNKFPRIKPDWLRNAAGYKLELDGFCEKLKIAFEYQGIQHFKEVKRFKRDLKIIQDNDALKVKLCETNNIKLFVILTFDKYIKISELKSFIIEECKKKNIIIPNPNSNIDISQAYLPFEYNKQQELEEIAIKKGGEILTKYSSSEEELLCKCNIHNYTWKALSSSITRDHWCPKCAEVDKKDLSWCQRLAINYNPNSKCLATEYTNTHTKLPWKCHIESHKIWDATANAVQQGKWCPECARESITEATKLRSQNNFKLELEKVKTLVAFDKNGFPTGIICKSSNYLGNKQKLLWNCPKDGHGDWWTTPNEIKTGRRCPRCGVESAAAKRTGMKFNKKFKEEALLKIKELLFIGSLPNVTYTCISSKYINDTTKLLFNCSMHGNWEMSPNSIKRGDRCPKCGVIKSSEGRKVSESEKLKTEEAAKKRRISKHIKFKEEERTQDTNEKI